MMKTKEKNAYTDMEDRLEFHRNAVALMPDLSDKGPGIAFYVRGKVDQQFCTCRPSGKKTCAHLKALSKAIYLNDKHYAKKSFEEQLKKGVWYRLATVLAEGSGLSSNSVKLNFYENNGKKGVKVKSRAGETVLTYFSTDHDRNIFAERLGAFSSDDHPVIQDRASVLERLKAFTETEIERELGRRGIKSRRQALEGSFWYMLAYHCHRNFGQDGCAFHPSVDPETGAFMVTCRDSGKDPVFHAGIPRMKVKRLLESFKNLFPDRNNVQFHPLPLKSIFKVSRNTELDLDVRPVIELLQEKGESRFYEKKELEKFTYGDLVFIKELGIMAELEKPGSHKKIKVPSRLTLKKYQVPEFLEQMGDEIFSDRFKIEPDIKGLRLIKTFDRALFLPEIIDRDWCWLSVKYDFYNSSITLAEILQAKKKGRRYIGTPDGWVDCMAPEFDRIGQLSPKIYLPRFDKDKETLKLSRNEVFRLSALSGGHPRVSGKDENGRMLSALLDMKPSTPPALPPMNSELRAYQKAGLHWLWWLYENRMGGILCDDMGLGKTHQMMALMLCIRKTAKTTAPFLVVCPTTVISHWMVKIKDHAPGLEAAVYHGGNRDLQKAAEKDIIITSYGILLKDLGRLKTIDFQLTVFDEIQHIKNADTKTYQAAGAIVSPIKLGMTGTPIENAVSELKALFDIVGPGYLGTDTEFKNRYMAGSKGKGVVTCKDELRQLIFPFTLRRMKSSVLSELPEKIEDIRFCSLSPQQVVLYKKAVQQRAKKIIEVLKDEDRAVPYMHIFALLMMLKQVCNHPALAEKKPEAYEDYQSGKWDLFKELLDESLDSGQKVVVYSQFVEMIKIIASHLKSENIGHVILTGASTQRGKLIEKFNIDPDCRVFVGSLKAGGTGIDLVAGSVVIHYDRWWNAAKEDQATDRVHRIGQMRGVQVFKLVTEGTLEEKISAIIENKKDLMESIVKEDDPGLLKSFNRKELLEMLDI